MARSNTRRRVSKKCKNVRKNKTTKGSKRSSSRKNRSMKKTTRKNKKGGKSSFNIPQGEQDIIYRNY